MQLGYEAEHAQNNARDRKTSCAELEVRDRSFDNVSAA
jgi:hypothetical protein